MSLYGHHSQSLNSEGNNNENHLRKMNNTQGFFSKPQTFKRKNKLERRKK